MPLFSGVSITTALLPVFLGLILQRMLYVLLSDQSCFSAMSLLIYLETPLFYSIISATDLPRLAAIASGLFISVKPLIVARTTLRGFVDPIDLANTL